MILNIADWQFSVDVEATRKRTTKNASDHCTCSYCKNYYETVGATYPEIVDFLSRFGVNIDGPSELMPFEPTLLLACYRVCGSVLKWGRELLSSGCVPVSVEAADHDTFFLWVGEMVLPWIQEEDMDEVVSPANLPEFLERMEEVWVMRHGENWILS